VRLVGWLLQQRQAGCRASRAVVDDEGGGLGLGGSLGRRANTQWVVFNTLEVVGEGVDDVEPGGEDQVVGVVCGFVGLEAGNGNLKVCDSLFPGSLPLPRVSRQASSAPPFSKWADALSSAAQSA
jgi:hypothetical protein